MLTPIATLALFLAAPAQAAPAHAAHTHAAAAHAPVRVEPVRGRLVASTPGRAGLVLVAGEPLVASSEGSLELGAGSEAMLHQDGAFSLRALGPGVLCWSSIDPAQGTDALRIEWTARAHGSVVVETRAGATRLALDGGWEIAHARGIVRAGLDASGASEVERLAGAPVRVVRSVAPFVEPARWLAVGERRSLPGSFAPRTGRTGAPAWRSVTWPFGEPRAGRALGAPVEIARERDAGVSALERGSVGAGPERAQFATGSERAATVDPRTNAGQTPPGSAPPRK